MMRIKKRGKRKKKRKRTTRQRSMRRKRRKTLVPAPQRGCQQAVKSSQFHLLARREHRIIQISKAPKQLETMIQQLMLQGQEKKNKMKIKMPIRKKHQSKPQPRKLQRRRLSTVTAAPRSPTPPPLFCFLLLLRVRRLLWWPRESEGERAMHRPHTHSSFSHSLCVSPCMDSRPHLIPRGTHIMCPLYICMHTHACPLVLSFARHAPLPSCLAVWAEHCNCFCFVLFPLH
ncbi:hypothetical protein ECC02_010165 [Trypanosoma cruzi]|uniref:Uncharacterized protein n=1 Tax=Trypanosoma cruzi TaxID=5693 RepID=A0A7J6XRY8_TRYCR|nr:hypothetical protein ECC02_010165 [Trypanosoma cruzi]